MNGARIFRSRPAAAAGRAARAVGAAALALVMATLAGCSGEQEELQGWMAQQRREVQPSVKPLNPPKAFVPVPYTGGRDTEPFSTQKLAGAVKVEVRQPSSAMSAEMNRRKEPLEAYPLDAMSMVGSLRRSGSLVALVRVDNLLYQVRPGDHLGQNYGRVTAISETQVTLRELAQDAAGDWTPRVATLQLQEPTR